MKRPVLSDNNQFLFELELEIGSGLGFSAGELCELVVDGLFALDDEGKLFRGITRSLRMMLLLPTTRSRSNSGAPEDLNVWPCN